MKNGLTDASGQPCCLMPPVPTTSPGLTITIQTGKNGN